jgi:hypothetical protein
MYVRKKDTPQQGHLATSYNMYIRKKDTPQQERGMGTHDTGAIYKA